MNAWNFFAANSLAQMAERFNSNDRHTCIVYLPEIFYTLVEVVVLLIAIFHFINYYKNI